MYKIMRHRSIFMKEVDSSKEIEYLIISRLFHSNNLFCNIYFDHDAGLSLLNKNF